MARLAICLFTDEMIPPDLAVDLRRQKYDAESCEQAGRSRQRIPDHEQLQYATHHNRTILTYNMGDFLRLDAEWKRDGRRHAGIIVSPEIENFGTLLRRVVRHLETVPPSVQEDVLLWLDSSPFP